MKNFIAASIFIFLFFSCQTKFDPVNSDQIALNFNEELLNEAFDEAANMDDLYSLLIGKGENLIIENYYNNFAADSLHDVRSVTKSITSILVGIAIDKGYITDTNQKMYTFFGSILDSIARDKLQIEIEHLLSMSGGFEWVPFGDWSEYSNWRNANDQINYILNKPIITTPGQVFNYNDAASHLLSVVVGEATNMDVIDFAQQYLFDPLNINSHSWIRDNRGYPLGCVALALTPTDMYKIGLMYLQNGVYDGKRVVSENWVSTSTQAHIFTGNVIPYGQNYGYLWWIDEKDDNTYFMAMGYGGQFIVVVPEKNLVVVATNNWRLSGYRAGQNWYNTISLIVNKIIPAAK